MTTLTEMATKCSLTLGDSGNSTWTAATVREFIESAIRVYSRDFPRTLETTITCAEDDRRYDLPAGLVAVINVEYPKGEDPPQYLKRMSWQKPGFWTLSGYYDVIFHEDAGDVAELVISEEPDADEEIEVTYEAVHDHDLEAGDSLTVPAQHLHMIVLYVKYLAYGERASYWSAYAGKMVEGPYQEAFEQWRAFQELAEAALREYEAAVAGASRPEAAGAVVSWKMDRWDRVY